MKGMIRYGAWCQGDSSYPDTHPYACQSFPILALPVLLFCSEGDEAMEDDVPEGLDDKVVQVYRGVGKLLSRYTVGKVPKAFKIIPNLKNWEEVLFLTDPDMWSPQAMFEVRCGKVSSVGQGPRGVWCQCLK